MMLHQCRHRRWIALTALLGLLLQQLVMAGYVCPLESNDKGNIAASAEMPPCHAPDTIDKVRCHQHCHPLLASFDHPSSPTVPVMLPVTTWIHELVYWSNEQIQEASAKIIARATAPPLTIQHCTFQI